MVKTIKHNYSKYTEKEFNILLAMVPIEKLKEIMVDNINKNTNVMKIKASQISNAQLLKKYYTTVCKTSDSESDFSRILNEYLKKTLDLIYTRVCKELGDFIIVKEKMVKDENRAILDKFLKILMETAFKKDLTLYFKCINMPLKSDLVQYIKAKQAEKSVCKLNKNSDIKEDKHNEKLWKLECEISEKDNIIATKMSQLKFSELNRKLSDDKVKQIKKENLQLSKENKDYLKKINELKYKENKYINDIAEKDDSLIKQEKKILELNEENEKQLKKINKLDKEIKIYREKIKFKEIELCNYKDKKLEEQLLINNKEKPMNNKAKLEKEIGNDSLEDKLDKVISGFKNSDLIYKTRNKKYEKYLIEEEMNFKYFIDEFSYNLEVVGVTSDYSKLLASYILAILKNKMVPLIVGYNARGIADSLSNLICNTSSDIIVLSQGFNDCKKFINQVDKCESEVVLIENAVDNIGEGVYLPLIKNDSNKIIIFSVESVDSLNIVSKSIYNYMVLVDINDIMGEEKKYSKLSASKNNIDYLIDNIEVSEKYPNKLQLKLMGFNNIIDVKLNSIINIMEWLEKGQSILSVVKFTLKSILQSEDRQEILIDFLKSKNYSDILNKLEYEEKCYGDR